MKRFAIAGLMLATVSACNTSSMNPPVQPPQQVTAQKPEMPSTDNPVTDGHRESTPDQPVEQPKNPTDQEISEKIRKQMMDSKSAANLANVKLSTRDGKVKLTGMVKTIEEKNTVEKIARSTAGDENVWSEIEVEQ